MANTEKWLAIYEKISEASREVVFEEELFPPQLQTPIVTALGRGQSHGRR